jgi:hypothetical protein
MSGDPRSKEPGRLRAFIVGSIVDIKRLLHFHLGHRWPHWDIPEPEETVIVARALTRRCDARHPTRARNAKPRRLGPV